MEVINRVLGGELAEKSNPAVDDIGVGDLSGLSTQRGLTIWETAKVGLNHHVATDQTVWKGNFVHLYAIFLLAFTVCDIEAMAQSKVCWFSH